jgi:hypothetical protein
MLSVRGFLWSSAAVAVTAAAQMFFVMRMFA